MKECLQDEGKRFRPMAYWTG